MATNRMLIRQLDRKIKPFQEAAKIHPPVTGWIKAIRELLNISFQQIANRMQVSPQAIQRIERREAEGSVTIKTLQEVAQAMELKFVYGFVPIDGSFEKLIEKKSIEAAKRIVQRTNVTMKLEDQENSKLRLNEAVKELADEIKKEVPKYLWD